jgi:hypothetical protein
VARPDARPGPADPTDPANYTEATVVKSYGDVYSGKKTIIYEGSAQQLTQQLDGGFGIHWDDVDSRLYWDYGFGYSSGNVLDIDSWCFGYSTLNYGANTGTGHGPWRLSGQSWKAAMSGFVGVPSAYARRAPLRQAPSHWPGRLLFDPRGRRHECRSVADRLRRHHC